jgi:hypothetical protein
MIASGLSGCLGKGCAWSFAGGLKRPLSILGITRAIVSGPDWQRARRRRGTELENSTANGTRIRRDARSLHPRCGTAQTMLPGGCFEAMMFRSKCRVDLLSAGASGCGKPVGRQGRGDAVAGCAAHCNPVAYRIFDKGIRCPMRARKSEPPESHPDGSSWSLAGEAKLACRRYPACGNTTLM